MLTQLTKPETKPRLYNKPFDMFQEVMRDWGFTEFPFPFRSHRTEMATWMPKMDVFEKEGELVLKADLPGVPKENVTVTVEDNYLVVAGDRKEEKEIKEENYYRMEREYGSFYRRLPLDFEVDPNLIKATFKEGILEVKVPILAKKGPEPKTIPIGT